MAAKQMKIIATYHNMFFENLVFGIQLTFTENFGIKLLTVSKTIQIVIYSNQFNQRIFY